MCFCIQYLLINVFLLSYLFQTQYKTCINIPHLFLIRKESYYFMIYSTIVNHWNKNEVFLHESHHTFANFSLFYVFIYIAMWMHVNGVCVWQCGSMCVWGCECMCVCTSVHLSIFLQLRCIVFQFIIKHGMLQSSEQVK